MKIARIICYSRGGAHPRVPSVSKLKLLNGMGYHNNLYLKCAQMDPRQLPKTLIFYSRCKKCDIEKTLGRCVPLPPFGSPKVRHASTVRPQQNFSKSFSCSCCPPLLSSSFLVPLGLPSHSPSTSLIVFLCFLLLPLPRIQRYGHTNRTAVYEAVCACLPFSLPVPSPPTFF